MSGEQVMLRKISRWVRDKFSDDVDMQKMLDQENITMYKTSPYKADDLPDQPMSWLYRFAFDNQARKRRFLNAVENYPAQEWDPWVRWMNDISYAPISLKDGETSNKICVEVHCKVPEQEVGRFMYMFERFTTKNLILKNQ
jgi:hypothetical protein